MVGHGNRQDARQHPNVVHGPNASPHRTGRRYAACKIQSSVRRKYGDQHRKRYERVIVRANQVRGIHFAPYGAAGRLNRKAAPGPWFGSAHKRPPCDSMIEREIAKPIPMP